MLFVKIHTNDLVKLYKFLSAKKSPNKHIIKQLIKIEFELEDRGVAIR